MKAEKVSKKGRVNPSEIVSVATGTKERPSSTRNNYTRKSGEKRSSRKSESPTPPARSLICPCPECGSLRVWKDGLSYTNQGPIQRWLCRNCGYRFSEPKVKINITRKLSKALNSGSDLLNGSITKREFSFL